MEPQKEYKVQNNLTIVNFTYDIDSLQSNFNFGGFDWVIAPEYTGSKSYSLELFVKVDNIQKRISGLFKDDVNSDMYLGDSKNFDTGYKVYFSIEFIKQGKLHLVGFNEVLKINGLYTPELAKDCNFDDLSPSGIKQEGGWCV